MTLVPMPHIPSLPFRRLSFWRLRRDRRGTAAVETALVFMFFLLPVAAGIVGVGTALLQRYRMDRAMHAALIWAWTNPNNAWQNPGTAKTLVAQQAQAGYGTDSQPLTTNVTYSCYCNPANNPKTSGNSTSCTGSCPTGQTMMTWVTVALSTDFVQVFNTPWVSGTWPLSATATVRVQ